MQEDKNKLEMIACKTFKASAEMVYLIDFLNKNLKNKGVILGITKDKVNDQMTVNIYEF